MVIFSLFSYAMSLAQRIVYCVVSLFGRWTRLVPFHLYWNPGPCDPKI
jgi:hypothetical protein